LYVRAAQKLECKLIKDSKDGISLIEERWCQYVLLERNVLQWSKVHQQIGTPYLREVALSAFRYESVWSVADGRKGEGPVSGALKQKYLANGVNPHTKICGPPESRQVGLQADILFL
jgi:hypothetical protein